MSGVTWTRLTTSTLIDLLKQHEELWNIEHSEYKNRALKDEAINNILEELRIQMPCAEVSDIKNKIHTLRSQYRREIREMEKERERGTSDRKHPRLWCFDELQFLGCTEAPPNKRYKREASTEIKWEAPDHATDEETADSEPFQDYAYVANEPGDDSDSLEKNSTLEARIMNIKLKRLSIDKRRNEIAAQQLEQTKRRNMIQSEILVEKKRRNAIEREKVGVMLRLENIFSDILEKMSSNSNFS